MLLKQKQRFKGSRAFEIFDDIIYVSIKKLFSKEKLTVSLSKLDPEPVVSGNELVFQDGLTSEPVFSLLINNPSQQEFDAFVNAIQSAILGQSRPLKNAQVEPSSAARPQAPGNNVYDEPPDYDDADSHRMPGFEPVNSQRLAEDISMLKTYLNESEIQPLLNYLEMLEAAPQNEEIFQQVVAAYNALGFQQGAVLTYAPYLKIVLSKYLTW